MMPGPIRQLYGSGLLVRQASQPKANKSSYASYARRSSRAYTVPTPRQAHHQQRLWRHPGAHSAAAQHVCDEVWCFEVPRLCRRTRERSEAQVPRRNGIRETKSHTSGRPKATHQLGCPDATFGWHFTQRSAYPMCQNKRIGLHIHAIARQCRSRLVTIDQPFICAAGKTF